MKIKSKEAYEEPVLEIVSFDTEDVIQTSVTEEDELPIIPVG